MAKSRKKGKPKSNRGNVVKNIKRIKNNTEAIKKAASE
jgi:hypothetical protein